MTEQTHNEQLVKRRFSRRVFLKRSAIGVGGVVGTLSFARIGSNELFSEPFSISNTELLKQALDRQRQDPTTSPEFGLYPDFERSRDPWGSVDEVTAEVGRNDYVGIFALFEDFWNAAGCERITATLKRIHARGSTPVLSLGTIGAYSIHKDLALHTHDHPLGRSNFDWIKKNALHIAAILCELDFRIDIRFLFEHNLRNSFVYGPNESISDEEHTYGYKRAVVAFKTAMELYRRAETRVIFNPGANTGLTFESFADTFPANKRKTFVDAMGVDIYDLFPGKGMIFHPYYWVYGKRSPDDVLLPALKELQALSTSHSHTPFFIYEIGSMTKDVAWIQRAALWLFALGGRGLLHFNYDKSQSGKLFEADWTIDTAIATLYKSLFDALSQFAQKPHHRS
ncbi:hypothetical protein C5B42_03690 [Candidatus Cerribacteria bacterium 'Amazon FNV 2010 28 9']|uniref:Glycoside hydrolase family 5 domain-containing protein n=1 Tax=Candidatus Cerribacteria bacterium 'Amazon FNV 2010 28 9' TaxID=2081795 RepID=A0A317JSI3_9BACT|nr:MAG: hypothetical protein C5B42_03690 [Candidatus Cerribacteria bacterium 'Amazon FNV 2010 28 9']